MTLDLQSADSLETGRRRAFSSGLAPPLKSISVLKGRALRCGV
jgi:hypothetical protein